MVRRPSSRDTRRYVISMPPTDKQKQSDLAIMDCIFHIFFCNNAEQFVYLSAKVNVVLAFVYFRIIAIYANRVYCMLNKLVQLVKRKNNSQPTRNDLCINQLLTHAPLSHSLSRAPLTSRVQSCNDI